MKTYIISLFIIIAIFFTGCFFGNKNQNSSTKNAHAHVHSTKDRHDHSAKDDHDCHDEDGHDHETPDTEGGHSDEIPFSKRQAEAVGLQVEEVTYGIFSHVIKTSGQILSAQGDEVTIAATSNGIVSFINSSLSDGASIRAGEAIVAISAKNLLDGDPAKKTKIAYETALKEYQRAEELIKVQIISAKEFEQTRLRYETAKTAYEAQASDITASGVKVASPVNGYIKNRLVNQGEYVSVGQPIATVSQNRRLQLRAEVSENYFKSLKNIGSANFQTSYDNTVYKLSDLNGRLLSFGKASDRQSFYIPVTFEFDNIGDFVPGSFVSVYLLSKAQDDAISIPLSAVTEEQGLHFVYLQVDEEGYKKQEVTLGQSNGDRIQIMSGVKPGDKVVIKGVYQVKLATASSVTPEGHSH
ncbi:MAG: efflux RND transporter periplasmic adaptor subunit [Tannerella sp.]|jgi:RND family efflux transporter MFP subunit|nr:efflux RND transporter periplasmic adaptor subunit [Tannerella sp.]